jgi:Hsp70 protein
LIISISHEPGLAHQHILYLYAAQKQATMALTLKNYETTLPKELQKAALKNPVRECDETEKGHFVAYVDEGAESYDVSLIVLANGEIKSATCDCKSGDKFCRHKMALLLYIIKDKQPKKPVKAAKKQNKSAALLDAADPLSLKVWLSELLAKNKDIELAFIHHFSGEQHQYTPAEVEKITNDAIKAVTKSKKNIDLTQLKKIVELWTEVHKPIIAQYRGNVADEANFLNIHALLEACGAYNSQISINSNRIAKYRETVLQQSAESLNQLEEEPAWNKAVGYIMDFILDQLVGVRLHYLRHLQTLLSISNEARKQYLLDALLKQYSKKPNHSFNSTEYTQLIFGLVKEAGAFDTYYKVFKPITWEIDYNRSLIEALIKSGHYSLAIQYSWDQMAKNAREEYNQPYLELLKQVYTLQNDRPNLARVLAELLPHTYSFADFSFIYAMMEDGEEKKKWRTKILSRARHASRSNNRNAIEFCFELLHSEEKYKKMVELIDGETPYTLIFRFFEPMVSADKDGLLKKIVEKTDHISWRYTELPVDKINDKECFPALLQAILRQITTTQLLTLTGKAKSHSFYYRENKFVEYVKGVLEE